MTVHLAISDAAAAAAAAADLVFNSVTVFLKRLCTSSPCPFSSVPWHIAGHVTRINTLQQAINIAHGNIKSVTERTEAFMRTAVLANHGLKASVEKLRLLIAKRRQDEAAQRRLQKAEVRRIWL